MTPDINPLAIILAGLIPSILGAIYYGPLLGKAWLSSLGKTEEEMKPTNMGLTYGLALVVSMLAALSLKMIIEMVHKDVSASGELIFGSFHTFAHGALHGAFICTFLVMPIAVSLMLFHKFSGKTILMNVVFWILCFAIMGAIVDGWT